MRIALLTDVFKRYPLRQALAAIARVGFEAIELNACYNWDPHVDLASPRADEQVHELAELLETHRLSLAAVAVYPDVSSLVEPERHHAVCLCTRAMELLAPLGCPLLTLMPYGSNLLPFDPQIAALRRSLDEVCGVAERHRMRVAMEVYPGNFVEDTRTLLQVIDDAGHDNLGYLLCLAHLAALGEDVVATYRMARPHLLHVHLSDTPTRTLDHKHLVPGHGEADLMSLARCLREDGYDGSLAVQIYSHEETAERSSAEALAVTRWLVGLEPESVR